MLLSLVAVLVLIYVYKLRKIYRTFDEMGLPGPPPRFFFGNAIELFTHRQHSAACLADWTKVYGKVYGYFIGHTPVICVSDPAVLQEIFITKFSHFHSRRPLPLQQHDLRHLLAATGNLDARFSRKERHVENTHSARCAHAFVVEVQEVEVTRETSYVKDKQSEEHNDLHLSRHVY